MWRFYIYGWLGRWLPHGKATNSTEVSALWPGDERPLWDLLSEALNGFTADTDRNP